MVITKVPNERVENSTPTQAQSTEQKLHNLCVAELGILGANLERTLKDTKSSIEDKVSELKHLGITPEKAGIDPDVFKAELQKLNSDPNMMLAFVQQFHDGKQEICRALAKEYAGKIEAKPNAPVLPM